MYLNILKFLQRKLIIFEKFNFGNFVNDIDVIKKSIIFYKNNSKIFFNKINLKVIEFCNYCSFYKYISKKQKYFR